MRTVTLSNDVLLAEVVERLNTCQTVTLRPKGVSMFPFIMGDSDSVILRRNAGKLAKHDIVLAELTPGYYVLHRVVGIHREEITLMGDGNLLQQERCTTAEIRAKVTEIVRDGRSIHCDTPAERRKARLWYALLPVRRYLLAIYRHLPAISGKGNRRMKTTIKKEREDENKERIRIASARRRTDRDRRRTGAD